MIAARLENKQMPAATATDKGEQPARQERQPIENDERFNTEAAAIDVVHNGIGLA